MITGHLNEYFPYLIELKRGRLKSELLKEYLLSLFAFGVVQFYPWLKFYFPLFQGHYQTLPYQKQGIKFQPRIKLKTTI